MSASRGIQGEERTAALTFMVKLSRVGRSLGYRFELEGWTLRLVRPGGVVAFEVTAADQTELAEFQAIVSAGEVRA